jgi:beta-glucosidase
MVMHLTLEEKAALVAGGTFWSTREIERAGIPSVMMTDGPHGLRKQAEGGDHLGLGTSVPSTCFPPAAGIASSFNPELLERVGRALGAECRAEGVSVLLGPGVNIKRSPLCGRNFEYFSEDPHVSGELGAAWVRGIQSQGVGASLKHFVANNQETNRMTVSAEVDERTLREIYLAAFETIVKREQPWTVMSSYNRVNGEYVGESHRLLTQILREEWGFDGLVVSDWGAVDNRVATLAAGLDLEMPGPQLASEKAIVEAVRSGRLDESVLDASVARVIALVERGGAAVAEYDVDAHHQLAREAAVESMVLLRNQDAVLPFAADARIAVIGEFARSPRFQGAGSSQVEPTRIDSALDALTARATVEFAPGYALGGARGRATDAALAAEAVALASRMDVALLFVGLPEGDESEGFDRAHLDLPADQVALIHEVTAANPRTVVVLTNGGVVSLEPWHDSVAGILEAWLLGQAGGSAVADVVLGHANPSGRLAETIPLRVQDNPSYLNFPGDGDVVRYGEGVFVGYRYYESAEVPVRYPFGHGLSYTTFEYSDISVSPDGVVVTVTNTGDRAGAEVVQVYVAATASPVRTPARELRAFRKLWLAAGQSITVTIPLEARAFSYWDVATAAFEVAGGEYSVQVGRSAHDVELSATVSLPATRTPGKLTLEASVTAWLAHPVTGPIFRRAAAGASGGGDDLVEGGASVLEMVGSMPMRRLLSFPGVPVTEKQLRLLMAVANNRFVERVAKLFAR